MDYKKTINVRIPIGLKEDLNVKLIQNPPDFKYSIDYFIFFLEKLFSIPVKNKMLEGLYMIPIYSVIVREEIGRNYEKYIKWLINNNFIVTDNHYIVSDLDRGIKGKCKCFAYTDVYLKKPLEIYKITKKNLIKQRNLWFMKNYAKLRDNDLLKYMGKSIKELDFDYEKAEDYLKNKLKSGLITSYKYEVEIYKCEKIRDKEIYIVKDKYGRIHSNYTTLSKDLRQFITCNGEKMVGIDIQSCQPGLLHSILKQEYLSLEKEINNPSIFRVSMEYVGDYRDKYVKGLNNHYSDSKRSEYLPDFMELVRKDGFFMLGFSDDLYKYEKVLKNDIYEWIRRKLNRGNSDKIDRKMAKKMFFRYIFGRVNSFGNKISELFKKEFPVIHMIIGYIKKTNYRTLARLLQVKESGIVIGELCGKLMKSGYNTFYTVHDSIYVPSSDMIKIYNMFAIILRRNNVLSNLQVD